MKVTVRKESPSVSLHPAGFYPPPHYQTVPAAPPAAPPVPVAAAAPASTPPTAPAPAAPAPPAAAASAETSPNEYLVRAPIVGTYYQSPSPDSDPFVSVGSSVTEGSVLCIIEAMKLMNEIESEVSGTVKEILVQDAEPVEYDQPLFVIEKA